MAPVRASLLDPHDAQSRLEFEALLATKQDLYPGIVAWFRRRVLPEIGAPRRRVWAIRDGEGLAGEAILKISGRGAKLCSLFLDPRIRGGGIAAGLLVRILADARRSGAVEIHFTIGEDAAVLYAPYFERIGFTRVGCRARYRQGVDELLYSAAPALVDAALAAHLRRRVNAPVEPLESWASLSPSAARLRRTQAGLFTALR